MFYAFFVAKGIFGVKKDKSKIYYVMILVDFAVVMIVNSTNIPKLASLISVIIIDILTLYCVINSSFKEITLLEILNTIVLMFIDIITYVFAINVININRDAIYDINLTNCILGIISKLLLCAFFFFIG